MSQKSYVTYNEVWFRTRVVRSLVTLHGVFQLISILVQAHKLCQKSAEHILSQIKPNLMIAIGGGGYIPARILR